MGAARDRNQNPLGSNPRGHRDRAHSPVGGDAVDGMAARLSAAARASLVRAGGCAGLPAADLLLVVVPFRRLRALDLHRRRVIAASGGFAAIGIAIGMSV